MGIKVEMRERQARSGKKFYYVVADFEDGEHPVVKGPMSQEEAQAMVNELRAMPAGEGVVVLDKPQEEYKKDVVVGAFVLASVAALAITISAIGWAFFS
jgi:hypothetical protein